MLQVSYKKQFPEKTMEVSFQSGGGITVFFGRSGAGKSVTLRCLAGLILPDEGKITVSDHIYFDSSSKINLTPQQRRTGYVFQSYALFPHLTVARNLALAINGNTGNSGRKIHELLEEVGIAELHDRLPHDLSGGEQQRVALARAMARDPQILLLDEPFSAVDAPSRDRLRHLLKKVQRQRNIPAILVTHQPYEAFSMADRIVVMDEGGVAQTGTPQEVFYQPQTLKTARLVGAKNIFPGIIESISGNRIVIKQNNRLWEAETGPANSLTKGQSINWCIRPESVMLLRQDREGYELKENKVKGTVTEVERKGPVWELFLLSEDNLPFKIEIPAHAAQQMQVSESKMVVVSLKKEAIHIISEGSKDEGS